MKFRCGPRLAGRSSDHCGPCGEFTHLDFDGSRGGPSRVDRQPLGRLGTDLDLTVHASTEAIGITDGVCVAPAKLLADITRSLEPGAVTIESEGNTIEIGACAPLQPAYISGG